MRVLLLRNFQEAQNLSMKLYADRLGAALRQRCEIVDVVPWSLPGIGKYPQLLRKGLEYGIRYGTYPASLLRRRADVFHIVDHGYAHLGLCLPQQRTVVTCHDIMLLKLAAGEFGGAQKSPRIATGLLRLSLEFLRKVAAVVAVSQATAEDLSSYLKIPRERIEVVHHGVEGYEPPRDGEARKQARREFALADGPVLLHVGNNWFYKNLEGLMRALALLRQQHSMRNAVLLRVGRAMSREQHELGRSLGISDAIRELGMLEAWELQKAYWAADVLVFPSLWEGFGWPPLEAMSSGTPVVCSHAGALAEITGDAAEVVQPDNPESIAAGVCRVLEDSTLRQSLICRGFARVRQFTWERAAARMMEIYRRVTEQSPDNG